jgi:hypothetical protein
MRVRLRLTAEQAMLAIIVGLSIFMPELQFRLCGRGAKSRRASSPSCSRCCSCYNALFARAFLGQTVSRPFLDRIGGGDGRGSPCCLSMKRVVRPPHSRRVIMGIGFVLSLARALASTANVMQSTKRADAGLPMPSDARVGHDVRGGANVAYAFDLGRAAVILAGTGHMCGPALSRAGASAVTFSLYFGLIRQIGPARARLYRTY